MFSPVLLLSALPPARILSVPEKFVRLAAPGNSCLGRKQCGNNEIHVGFSVFLLCLFENLINSTCVIAVYVVEDQVSIPDRISSLVRPEDWLKVSTRKVL